MTLAADIASDMATFDGVETVTLTDVSASTSDTSVTGLRGPLSFRETMLNGPAGLEPGDMAWNLQANTTAIVPAPGDTITDGDSVVWTILSVAKMTLGTRWRCVSRQQR